MQPPAWTFSVIEHDLSIISVSLYTNISLLSLVQLLLLRHVLSKITDPVQELHVSLMRVKVSKRNSLIFLHWNIHEEDVVKKMQVFVDENTYIRSIPKEIFETNSQKFFAMSVSLSCDSFPS